MDAHIFSAELQKLEHLLKHLPASVPVANNHYNFASYVPSERSLDLTGDAKSAVNRDLELTFGSRHASRILHFKERGPGLEAVVQALANYITSRDDAVLIQWMADLTASAEAAITEAGQRVPRLTKPTEKRALEIEDRAQKDDAKRRKTEARKARGEALRETEQAPPFKFEDLEDVDEKPIGTRGTPPSLFLRKYARPCRSKSKGLDRFRCTRDGCKWSCASPRQTARVGKHIAYDCAYASEADREEALRELDGQSLAVKVATAEAEAAAAPAGANAFVAHFREAGAREREEKANHLLLLALCDSAVAIAIVNNRRWRNFFEYMNSAVTIRHGSTFAAYVVTEAAHVRKVETEELQKQFNLTVSFDGGSIRRQQSIYTVHAITPETRAAFLLDGDEASGVSHDARHIANTIMDRVGRINFSGCTSDDQSACRGAKEMIAAACPHIIVFVDPCHRLSNTGKDIGKLSYFEDCISKVKVVIKYFHKSNFAATHLAALRVAMDISEGLVSIGNTRFLTLYYAGTSLDRCMVAIEKLVTDSVVDVSGKEHQQLAWLQNRAEVMNFTLRLVQLTTALRPLARACKCLEASQSNVSDVFVFWLAIMATYTETFRQNREAYPEDIIRQIRAIVNSRYAQTMSGTHGLIYLAGFFLNPEYIDSPILRNVNLNPLSTTVTLRTPLAPGMTSSIGSAAPAAAAATPPPDADLRQSIPTYAKVGGYLMQVLKADLNVAAAEKRHVKVFDVFKSFDTGADALAALRSQFMHYTRGDEPFTRDKKLLTPMQYWKKLKNNDNANMLAYVAIKLFSLTPNSMADERTMSSFSGFNSPDRASQDASTVVNMTQIRDHYRRQLNPPKASDARPVPRFRDLKPYIKKSALPAASSTQTAHPAPSGAQNSVVIASTVDATPLPAATVAPSEATAQSSDSSAKEPSLEPQHALDIDAELGDHEPLDAIAVALADRVEFEASSRDGFDLTDPTLLDILSDKQVAGASGTAPRKASSAGNEKNGKKNDRLHVDLDPVF